MRKKINPKVILDQYKNGKIDRKSLIDILISIIENSDKNDDRIKSLEILSEIRLVDQKLFSILKELLISDEIELIRNRAAKFIINNFPNKCGSLIEWAIKYEISPQIISIFIESFKKDNEKLLGTILIEYFRYILDNITDEKLENYIESLKNLNDKEPIEKFDLGWLISNNAREQFMNDMEANYLKDNSIVSNDKVLTFNDFIILTRSSPAKSLGIGSIKGNLGLGADGDLNILNLVLNDTDISKDYEHFKSALGNIEYVVKAGEIIKNHEKINLESSGKILWASGKPIKEDAKSILEKKEVFYQKYYSNFYDSYSTTINKEILREIA